MNRTFLFLLLALMASLACTHETPQPGLKHASSEYYDSKNEQIANFDRDLRTAADLKINERAPKEYQQAQESFSKARELARDVDDEKDLEKFRDKMHEARMHLDRAQEVAQRSAK